MIDTIGFYNYLCKKNLDFFVGVPDSLLKELCSCIKDNTKSTNNIIAANEGNAVGICSGYHLSTGKFGVLYMQNSGLGNTINPLLSLADEEVYGIPMLLIIGWRGEPGVHDEPQHVKQGKVTLSILDTIGIEYLVCNDNYQDQIDYCYDYMKKNGKSIALIIKKGTFSNYPSKTNSCEFTLTREESLKAIISKLNNNDFVVSTTGKTSREIFEIREQNKQTHENDFLTVGSMGHTASIAFGMSIGTKKNIYCIDGDGSFIMHMGGFAVIAQNAQSNFHYIMINNGSHESVGGQPTVAFDIDIVKILLGCGFKKVFCAKSEKDIFLGMEKINSNPLSALIIFTKQGSRDNLGRPSTSPKENKIALMTKILTNVK